MPWCEECAKYMAPSAMNDDGTCPTCGDVVETPTTTDGDAKAPWHFKLMVVAVVVYLVWRVGDMIS